MTPVDQAQAVSTLRILDDIDQTERQVSLPLTGDQLRVRLLRYVRRHNRRDEEDLCCCLHLSEAGLTLHWYMTDKVPEKAVREMMALYSRREEAIRFLQTGRNC